MYNDIVAIDACNCTLHTLFTDLLNHLKQTEYGDVITIKAIDPDLGSGKYAGEILDINGRKFTCRGWQSWVTLASILECRMLTPVKSHDENTVTIRLQRLERDSFHKNRVADTTEKYGSQTLYSNILKNEEPGFYFYFRQALKNLNINKIKSVLDLGINRADEFDLIRDIAGNSRFDGMNLTGIDHSASAISEAKKRFGKKQNVKLICHDINLLDELDLKRYDLIISIATLQSPGVNTKTLVMDLLQKYLAPGGSFLFAFPNSRWIDGELIYGAAAPNYSFSEMSLVIKDIHWIKKYLQQHGFRVMITGREYLFLAASKIRRKQ